MRAKQTGAAEGQRFEILKQLGSGGFGAVFEAFDRESRERVALKELMRVGPSALFPSSRSSARWRTSTIPTSCGSRS